MQLTSGLLSPEAAYQAWSIARLHMMQPAALIPFAGILLLTAVCKDKGAWAMSSLLTLAGAGALVFPDTMTTIAAATAAVGSMAVVISSRRSAALQDELQEMREQIRGMAVKHGRRVLRDLNSEKSGDPGRASVPRALPAGVRAN
jgi:hypothetical protein